MAIQHETLLHVSRKAFGGLDVVIRSYSAQFQVQMYLVYKTLLIKEIDLTFNYAELSIKT